MFFNHINTLFRFDSIYVFIYNISIIFVFQHEFIVVIVFQGKIDLKFKRRYI